MTPALLCVILAYLVAERICHERRLARIPIRIHVNGIRGKSSVTRLIAAALRRSGIRTLAKTTGSLPKLVLPDGSEQTILRRSPANILEQMKIVKLADKMNARAIVVECMALEPNLQFVSESKMIRSTVGVITNVRPDHFEVMGECMDDIAEALSGTIPSNGVVVTADRRYHSCFSEAASAKGSRVVFAGDSDSGQAAEDLSYNIFRENIEIAQSVCRLLGLDPAVVMDCLDESGFAREGDDMLRVSFEGKTIYFLDAFAANDIESTRIVQERFFMRGARPRPWIALFNHRFDRPLRMKSFADGLLAGYPYDRIAVTGEGSRLARCYLRKRI
ncbi:MAG: poly-gamma-glutamate synthase PgsB, partial [Syntrophorhabdaceae bacterium]|nr:poly-gamma-glutamate synthase PgsB [Syntrophorhabdaceae bacterium]